MMQDSVTSIPHHYRHALLIDDDVFTLDMVALRLEDLGVARVTKAGGGEQGLRALGPDGTGADLIVCDINMPRMDGFQLMELLAARRVGCPIILMSGLAQRFIDSAQLMARFHHLNILGALKKPLDKRELAQLLARPPAPAAP
ncbi:response regulator [Pseudoduganella namucuonensis]|uniref:Two-component system, chemotaxis family, response regulator CheY n=1 Tax=Pseudoduganella namucuonensis TaxID=1035707 RepID=A0A1I7H703_9BURK|nr:response regulator [Pseudoduganella namucuonensis]SFU56424.1 two-component system, chemotaxis family, response regulator CheY [Pseudoduganella namucuonensis]